MRLKFLGVFLWGIFQSAAAIAAIDQSAAYSLGVDNNTGHPRIRWADLPTNSSFVIARYHRGAISECPDPSENLIYSASEDVTKCSKTITQGSHENYLLEVQTSDGAWRYTDKAVIVDEVDADEYKFTVRLPGDPEADAAIIWAASCSMAEGQDPLEEWVKNFNQRVALGATWLKRSDIPNIPPGTPNDTVRKNLPITTGKNLILLANSKYVAVFTDRGNLIGLTNRSLGEEFITFKPEVGAGVAKDRDPFSPSNAWSWYLKYGIVNGAKENICTETSVLQGGVLSSLVKMPDPDPNPNPNPIDGKLRFVWSNLAAIQGSVETEWNFSNYDGTASSNSIAGLTGKIIVNGNLQSGGVVCTSFPQLVGLGLKGAGDTTTTNLQLIVPSTPSGSANNNGSVVPGYPATLSYSAVTNNGHQLHLAGVLKNGKALLIATNNTNHHPTRYFLANYWKDSAGTINPSGSFIDHYTKDKNLPAQGSLINSDYGVTLRPMCGNWSRVSKAYRRWALSQPWANSVGTQGSSKKTIARSDINGQLKSGLFWWLEFMTDKPLTFAESVNNKNKQAIGNTESGGRVPIGIHLYSWYKEPFDYEIPQFSTRDSASEAVQTLSADNTLVVPYINVNGIDLSNRPGKYGGCEFPRPHGWYGKDFSYDNMRLEELAMQRASEIPKVDANDNDSEIYYGTCYKGSPEAPDPKYHIDADPSQSRWQSIVAHNTDKALSLGGGGVYFDTYGVGYHPDYSHGHEGHGDWWLKGQLDTGNAARAKLANDMYSRRILAAEFFNEGLMSNTDIIFNYAQPKLTDIPLIWSVYSGYQIYGGGNVNKTAGFDGTSGSSNKARHAIWGRSFVWGSQLGFSTHTILCPLIKIGASSTYTPSCPANIAYLKELAMARNHPMINKYLAYGELMELADDTNPLNKQLYAGIDRWCEVTPTNNCEGEAAKVRGARWQDADGASELIVLTNTSSESVSATIRIPLRWRNIEFCDLSGQCSAIQSAESATLEMPPLSVRLLRSASMFGSNSASSSSSSSSSSSGAGVLTATASSVENADLGPALAIDASLNTRWSSVHSDLQWIQVDLGTAKSITGVDLVWETASAKNYTIAVSANGATWTTVAAKTDMPYGARVDTINFSPIDARYVRMNGTARTTVWGYSLFDFRVNTLSGSSSSSSSASSSSGAGVFVATASSVESDDHLPVLAVDSDLTTRWSSEFSDPQWIQVDLGASKNITGVELLWETASAQNYTVAVSTNGTDWTTVATKTNMAYGPRMDTINFLANARYVRVNGTARTTEWGYSLYDFKINTL